MCNPHMKEDEYVDYSCSTAVERLTRDVESLLRSWHVHDGCDRHFSVSTDCNGLTLLRAERLNWIAALPGRRNLRIELELALWDGPASRAPKRRRNRRQSTMTAQGNNQQQSTKPTNRRSSVSNDECINNVHRDGGDVRSTVFAGDSLDDSDDSAMSATRTDHYGDEEEEDLYNHLPLSLRRSQHPADVTEMPDSLFDNFSTMFGIGQHITLTPTNPSMDLGALHGDLDMDDSSNPLVFICRSLLGRHKPTQAPWVLKQLLASWFQTALNCAAINCQSCIPVFGVWGNYPSSSLPSLDDAGSVSSCFSRGTMDAKAIIPIFPAWLEAAQDLQRPVVSTAATLEAQYAKSKSKLTFTSRRRRKNKRSSNMDPSLPSSLSEPWIQNVLHSPAVVTGSVVPTIDTYANFTCSILPQTLLDGPVDRLSTWGNLLLRHCRARSPSASSQSVVLSGAKHVYAWSKSKIPASEVSAWRGLDPKQYWKQQQSGGAGAHQNYLLGSPSLPMTPSSSLQEEIEDYRHACRAHALLILEQSAGNASWGPRQDPILALLATLAWKSRVRPSENGERAIIDPVGSFPSPQACDASGSLLNPKQATHFEVQTFLDQQALEPTLATTQRCILACMIRTSTLAPLTLLQHLLWEEDIVEDWDHEAGNKAALQVAQKAHVGEATRTLVDVMDWKTCAEEMISEREAEAIVNEVFEGTSSFGFPSPPEDMYSPEHSQQRGLRNSHPLLEPLFQSAPVGRLVSDLCMRMAQLRAPCSMALVWSTFCGELRRRWEIREPIPNMNFVAGLDPSPTTLAERRKVSTIGVKAELAAFLNCSEADPDDQHCLLGQKLQVFNIGIETMSVLEELSSQHHSSNFGVHSENQWGAGIDFDGCQQDRDAAGSPTPERANSTVSLGSDGNITPVDHSESLEEREVVKLSDAEKLQLPPELCEGGMRNDSIIDGLLPKQSTIGDEEEMSLATGGDSMSDFFDADGGMTIFSAGRSIFTRNINLAASAVQRIERKGARCPLHGCSLIATGDQVYAPYLRRPEPLTDDVILERRRMLSVDYCKSKSDPKDPRAPIQKRLEIACRLQKPKLLSDMNAFKAANPGAIFQDFVSWYGNPGNPLEDYCTLGITDSSQFSGGINEGNSVAMSVEKATEAIHILNETRDFWSNTWEESVPIPASEQKSLFDVFSIVEMTLDYLENMHPAILMNQVMAVTMSNSYFLLVASAKDSVKVPVVEAAVRKLREKTEKVLNQLADEAANATRTFYNMQAETKRGSTSFVSLGLIKSCEAACACFSETEVLIALATSLLHKFPGQYETVQSVLEHADGDKIELRDATGQSRVLDAIARQQSGRTNRREPKPVLREYLLKNLDDSNPCQLSVRYGDSNLNRDAEGTQSSVGLMVALTTCHRD